MNFAKEIEHAAGGEQIDGICIGAQSCLGWDDDYDRQPLIPTIARDTLLAWAAARPYLDYEHDGGYGAPDCHAITAWTANKVIFVHEYDGATSVHWLPRHPISYGPSFDGQDPHGQ